MMIGFFTCLIRDLAYGLICIVVLASPAHALPFSLKPLKAEQVKVVKEDNALVTVAMIYQPNCAWCKKQGQSLAKVFEQCQGSINLALVGTKGNARQLKKELKHYHKELPAFMADRNFLRSIGGYQASPTTLIFDTGGELIAKKRGYIPQDKLAHVLGILSQGECQI